MRREIQSVEISCLVHATEDERKVADSIMARLGVPGEPVREKLEGHYGNEIIRLKYHLKNEEAWAVFRNMVLLIGEEKLKEILMNLDAFVDEHSVLYVRLSKQKVVKGELELSSADPIRVRVKPRSFMMGGNAVSFYKRLMEQRG